jgi:hypothetical protein
MVKRFSKIVLFVFYTFAAISNTKAQNEFAWNSSAQIISAKQIKLSGVSRLSDLYTLLNDWYPSTIDGYRWKLNSLKSSFSQIQDWILMLDGQRIDLNFFGEKNINFLPISSRNIDSITVYSSPVLLNGEISTGGLININTVKPRDGFSFHSEIFAGNESGDPGPYKYVDEYYSENIDIIGPDYSFGIDYGGNSINASLNYKTNAYIYPSADSPIYYRVGNYDFKYRKVFTDAVSLLLNLPTVIGKPRIFAGYTGTGKYNILSRYGSDLIFYDPLFCEVPADNKFTHIGISGSLNITNRSILNYSAKWSSTKTKNPEEHNNYLVDWRMDNLFFNTNYHRHIEISIILLAQDFLKTLQKLFILLKRIK